MSLVTSVRSVVAQLGGGVVSWIADVPAMVRALTSGATPTGHATRGTVDATCARC